MSERIQTRMEIRQVRVEFQLKRAFENLACRSPKEQMRALASVLPLCDVKSMIPGEPGVAISRDQKGHERKVGGVFSSPGSSEPIKPMEEAAWIEATSARIRYLLETVRADTLSLPADVERYDGRIPSGMNRLLTMKLATSGAPPGLVLSARLDGIESPSLAPETIVHAAEVFLRERLFELGIGSIGIPEDAKSLTPEQNLHLHNIALVMNVVAERSGFILPIGSTYGLPASGALVRIYGDPSITEILLHTDVMAAITGLTRESLPLRFVLSPEAISDLMRGIQTLGEP